MKSEKKLYWEITSNIEVSVTVQNFDMGIEIIKNNFKELTNEEQSEVEYKLIPVWLTDRQYKRLPESDNY